jgi:hypothetical protein
VKKKPKGRILTKILTVLFVITSVWFVWEWQQQPKESTLGLQTNPKHTLLIRCLEKAQSDYDRDVSGARSSPAPNLAQIAAETFGIDKTICHNIYDK